jgi:hypothetical protein
MYLNSAGLEWRSQSLRLTLAMLFVLLELHRLAILRELNPTAPAAYRVGFALINALVLGKIILIADAFHLGECFKDKALDRSSALGREW